MRTFSADEYQQHYIEKAKRLFDGGGFRFIIERDGEELVVAADIDDGTVENEGLVIGAPGRGNYRQRIAQTEPHELTNHFVFISLKDQARAEELWAEQQDEDREARREAAAEMRGAL